MTNPAKRSALYGVRVLTVVDALLLTSFRGMMMRWDGRKGGPPQPINGAARATNAVQVLTTTIRWHLVTMTMTAQRTLPRQTGGGFVPLDGGPAHSIPV